MTNHLPSFEENQPPNSNAERYDNLTTNESWQRFLDVAQDTNEQFVGFDEDAPGSDQMLESYNRRLNEYIDIEYSEQKARVVGLADIIDINGTPTGEEYLLSELDNVTFDGIGVYPVDNKWRVRLMFYSPRQNAENQACYYYVPADKYHIYDLQIKAQTLEEQNNESYSDAVTNLVSNAIAAADLTSSDDFLSISTEQQHKRLRQETAHISKEFLPHYLGLDVTVSCSQYYAIPDDMIKMGLPIEMYFTDQTNLRQDEMFEPSGVIYNCNFLEQDQNPQRHFTKPADFNLGFGAPCLYMYDSQRKCTFYILPQTISSIDLPEDTGRNT